MSAWSSSRQSRKPRGIEELIQQLGHKRESKRQQAVTELVLVNDPRFDELLEAALADTTTARLAAEVVARRIMAGTYGDYPIAPSTVAAAAEGGVDNIHYLAVLGCELEQSDDTPMRRRAVGPLIECLTKGLATDVHRCLERLASDGLLADWAADAAARGETSKLVEVLRGSQRHELKAVRRAVAEALAPLDDSSFLRAVAAHLGATDYAEVREAIRSRGGAGTVDWLLKDVAPREGDTRYPDVARPLLRLALEMAPDRASQVAADIVTATSISAEDRAKVVRHVISELDDPRSLDLLRTAASSPSPEVHRAAAACLAQRGVKEFAEEAQLLEEERKEEERRAAEAREAERARQAAIPQTCAACGSPALSTEQFVEYARQAGWTVDSLTGDATRAVSGVLSGVDELAAVERQVQADYEVVEERRGYLCSACGKVHCTACLMKAPQHPATRGPRCPSCGEGPHSPW